MDWLRFSEGWQAVLTSIVIVSLLGGALFLFLWILLR